MAKRKTSNCLSGADHAAHLEATNWMDQMIRASVYQKRQTGGVGVSVYQKDLTRCAAPSVCGHRSHWSSKQQLTNPGLEALGAEEQTEKD